MAKTLHKNLIYFDIILLLDKPKVIPAFARFVCIAKANRPSTSFSLKTGLDISKKFEQKLKKLGAKIYQNMRQKALSKKQIL